MSDRKPETTAVGIERIRIDLMSRSPVAARAMLFTGRGTLKPEPRRFAEACLKKGMAIERASENVYVKMTGIRLP